MVDCKTYRLRDIRFIPSFKMGVFFVFETSFSPKLGEKHFAKKIITSDTIKFS